MMPTLGESGERFRPIPIAWWPLLFLLLPWLGVGCSGPTLSQGPGGLSPNIADQLSFIVAQTRAQLPEGSGMGIPFKARETGNSGEKPIAEIALTGKGVSVRPGLQSEKPQSLHIALSLEKSRYAQGFARVTFNDGEAEQWPIIAYDLLGEPDSAFEHTYALVTAEGALRYLVVIGGSYEEDQTHYFGYEGTLIIPGKGQDPEAWEQAYKIDFGYRFPVNPPHEQKVSEVEALFTTLGRKADALERMQSDIAKAEGELASQQVRPPSSVSAADHQLAMERNEVRLVALRAKMEQTLAETEEEFLRYYSLRRDIAAEFKLYLETNHYRWQPVQARQERFERWKSVEFHHPKIDERFHRFLRDVTDTKALLEARKTAMDTITGTNNWDRDPAKQRPQSPPPKE